jgi:gas vesicle protein
MAAFQFGKSEISTRRKTFLTALGCMAIGLGLGTLAGLLTAPKSGKQLRKDMQRKVDDAREAVENLGKRASDLMERGEEFAENAAETARRTAEPIARVFRRGA